MRKVTQQLKDSDRGDFRVTYKLRDWLISRQRYWGAPIPIIRCPKCGDVAVPESDLPVILPAIDNFKPADDGRSPLAKSPEFVNVKCPKCGGEAQRETETMDTFVDSSWYFLRYLDPEFENGPWNNDLARKWLPVDMYVGGAEHSVMHLLYARYFCMFLNDRGLIDFDEPFLKLRHQGMITNKGAKISKSRGNVINPDSFTSRYGSDTFRMYLMFMGSYAHGGDWDDSGINGISRFLGRVYRLVSQNAGYCASNLSLSYSNIKNKDHDLNYRLNLTIKRVSEDLDNLEFNTAVAALMELVNDLYKVSESGDKQSDLFYYAIRQLILLIAPMAPHLAEELWQMIGGKPSVFAQSWPSYDKAAMELATITLVVQINGKLRGSFNVPVSCTEDELFELASKDERVSAHLQNKTIRKRIFVPGKLMNIVVG